MNYGKAIKKLRVDKMNQTQGVFAERIGTTQTYISQIEKGRKKPSIDLLEKIAEHVAIPIPILFWDSITEEDVKEDRIDAYRLLKPTADALILSLF